MEEGQKELTDRIRSAIKEKLVEINAFVDDELPDYIMILVANKRSKSQIEKDLSLFLGNDTILFTNWLWDLVKNLKSNPKVKPAPTTIKKDDSHIKKDVESDDDVDVLDYDLDEQERAIFDQEEDSKISQFTTISNSCGASKVTESPQVVETKSISNEKTSPKNVNQGKVNEKAERIHSTQRAPHMPLLSTVAPVKHAINTNDAYDPAKPDFSGNLSSVVRVSQRNYGGPAALQANKLLLKAVNDATKSILRGHSITDFYKPTPINVLSSNKKDTELIRTPNLATIDVLDATIDFNAKPKDSIDIDEISNDSNMNDIEIGSYTESDPSQSNRSIFLASESTHLNVFNDILTSPFDINRTTCSKSPFDTNRTTCSESPFDTNRTTCSEFPFDTNRTTCSELDEQKNSPHFIVTLDGVDLPSFKRKYDEINLERMEVDEDDVLNEEQDESISITPEKKQRLSERCKYWPACKNNNSCAYHHPTIQCKCFPDCKYGDKCLYIHPNCKFDAFCSRKDCPYTHASKRKFDAFSSRAVPPVIFKTKKRKSVCKFYPNCTVKKCPFIHPKLCRYGAKCKLRMCPYSHLSIPPRNQMKWKSTI